MKDSLLALATLAAAAVATAADLQAAGAVRPDHETKWGALRTTLDQLQDATKAAELAAVDGAPVNPDAAAFENLGHQVETLALTVDTLHDQVAALAAKKA